MIGVGIDAVEIARFRALLERRPGLVDRLFSRDEQLVVVSRSDPVPGLAARFAAKEATLKTFGVGLGAAGFVEIEVLSAKSGAPFLRLSGSAERLAEGAGAVRFHVSLTHTESLAQAIVVAL